MRTTNFKILFAVVFSAHLGSAQLQCEQKGECVGILSGFLEEENADKCHNSCFHTVGCNWYTFYEEDSTCNFFATCDYIDNSTCSTCVTGEADCPICGLDGICLATELHYESVNSVAECEDLCRDRPDNDCNFYSYGDFKCWLFAACEFQSEAICPNCMSSQVGCATGLPSSMMPPLATSTESQSDDFDLLLVIGGYNGTNLAEVELVSLDPDNYPVPPCLDNLKELPVARYAAAGALDEYGNPFLCGGVTFQSYQIIYNECFKYDPQRDSWEQHGTMPYYKGFIADTEVNGLGLVMVGGKGDSEGGEGVMYESTDDVIATTDGMTFQKLDQLPRASSKGCVTKINDSTLLYSGGEGTRKETYKYDINNDAWTRMSDLSNFHSYHGCGCIDAQDGSHVIAAGSYNQPLKGVEKYNVLEDSWTYGNDLPFELNGADSVPYEDTFALVGGLNDTSNTYSDAILLYKPTDDTWIVMEGALKTPKELPTVISVKRSIFPKCEDGN